MSTTAPVVVIGSGLAGLTTALLLARAGLAVTVLERDPAPAPPPNDAWETWDRPRVSQFRHPHVMLPRWRHLVERELPDVLHSLHAAGAGRLSLLHLQPDSVTHGWRPGDEDFETVAVRRPVLEAVLARVAACEVDVVRDARAVGLVADSARVTGVVTSAGVMAASLVVDAGGRRTPVPALLRDLGLDAPVETREDHGLLYWGRHFVTPDGRAPSARGGALTHFPALSLLTLPGDRGTFSVTLVGRADDRALRGLRFEDAWCAVADLLPQARAWIRCGRPTTGVVPIAGIEDLTRRYSVEGLVAVGDALVATNPSLGRGASLGLMQALVLRDVVGDLGPTSPGLATEVARRTEAEVGPWVDATTWFDRHRVAEMGAEMAGAAYDTDDLGWLFSLALRRGPRTIRCSPGPRRGSAGCWRCRPTRWPTRRWGRRSSPG